MAGNEIVERCAEWLTTNVTRIGGDNVKSVAAAMVAEVSASNQPLSDDVVERITQSVLQTTWGYPGPSAPVVKSVREGVRAALAKSRGERP